MTDLEARFQALTQAVETEPSVDAWVALGDWLNQINLVISACFCYQNARDQDPLDPLPAAKLKAYQASADALRSQFAVPRRPPSVSIVMLTYNQLAYTQLAVESILAKTPELLELILIDNASSDDTPAWLTQLSQEQPRVRVQLNTTNTGFARGCNQGLQLAQGEYVMVLNNDILVTHGWLARLLTAFDNPEISLVGPVATHVSGLQAVVDIPPALMAEEDLLEEYAQQRALAFKHQGRLTHRLTGTCLLFKREVLQRVGGFDPRYGIGNFEDDDFSYRALLAGFKLWIASDAFIHHFGSKSFEIVPLDVDALKVHNHQLFCQKWGLTTWPESWLKEPIAAILQQGWQEQWFVPLG